MVLISEEPTPSNLFTGETLTEEKNNKNGRQRFLPLRLTGFSEIIVIQFHDVTFPYINDLPDSKPFQRPVSSFKTRKITDKILLTILVTLLIKTNIIFRSFSHKI